MFAFFKCSAGYPISLDSLRSLLPAHKSHQKDLFLSLFLYRTIYRNDVGLLFGSPGVLFYFTIIYYPPNNSEIKWWIIGLVIYIFFNQNMKNLLKENIEQYHILSFIIYNSLFHNSVELFTWSTFHVGRLMPRNLRKCSIDLVYLFYKKTANWADFLLICVCFMLLFFFCTSYKVNGFFFLYPYEIWAYVCLLLFPIIYPQVFLFCREQLVIESLEWCILWGSQTIRRK